MPSITKPQIPLSPLPKNDLGLTIRDYEGQDVHALRRLRSRLGDGRDRARVLGTLDPAAHDRQVGRDRLFVQDPRPIRTRRPRIQLGPRSHGAHRDGRDRGESRLTYIGISGDGDSLSIGLGHLMHGIRRNVKMVYVIENNGVYGLTKGQMSASADIGSRPKKGEANTLAPIDPVTNGTEPRARRSSRAASPGTKNSWCRS